MTTAGRFQWAALDDPGLAAELAGLGLGLQPAEYRQLVEAIDREPTAVEVRIFDTLWSEHCSYKSSRRLLGRFPTEGPGVILGPGEDAGVVELGSHAGQRYFLVLAHESHNHPSQVMPIEGAATGVGGIVRDVFCMGAEVIGVLDALRFGDPSGPQAARVLNIADGVVAGVRSYANALGVPNLGGDVYFHPSFDDNCLVNVVAVGVCRAQDLVRSRVPPAASQATDPYQVLLVGKPTDATGFGGAAFASTVLAGDDAAQKEAVQVPDPFLKRVLFEALGCVLERARADQVPIGFKDLGAGGIACATVELAAAGGQGMEIDLATVATDGAGHAPEVIACAETQERFALVVPADFAPVVLEIVNTDYEMSALYPGAGATVVGRVVSQDRYLLRCAGEVVCDLPASLVTQGIQVERPARRRSAPKASRWPPVDCQAALEQLLGSPNLGWRGPIYHSYDTEVRGRAVVRPGEGDAAVLAPVAGAPFGVAMAVDGEPAYGAIDPYLAGAHAAYESMRNVVAAGAEPIALTDCLNFGNPEDPDVFGDFEAAISGIADCARGIGAYQDARHPVPVVSGNVSLYNESARGGAVAPSPIVACAGRLAELADATTMRVSEPGWRLLLVGQRRCELGGSELAQSLGVRGGALPPIDFETARAELYAVLDAIRAGWVAACHDIGGGGLLVTIAEMLLGESNRPALGAVLEWSRLVEVSPGVPATALAYGQAPGFVLAVELAKLDECEALFDDAGVGSVALGEVVTAPELVAGEWRWPVAALAEARGAALSALGT